MQNQTIKPTAHFLDQELVNPGNPILVNVIGTGATGTHVLEALGDIHSVLVQKGQPGLMVRAYDPDIILRHNCGRQRFTLSQIGHPKAAAKITWLNRTYGTDWKAMIYPFCLKYQQEIERQESAPIVISCVDTVKSRLEIEQILQRAAKNQRQHHVRQKWTYWMDFGNTRYAGQVQLGTLRNIRQPESEIYTPISDLPLFTQEYRSHLAKIDDNDEPSCSIEQSLLKQDLFVNPILAYNGIRMIYHLLTQQVITYRGLFLNIDQVRTVPMSMPAPAVELTGQPNLEAA